MAKRLYDQQIAGEREEKQLSKAENLGETTAIRFETGFKQTLHLMVENLEAYERNSCDNPASWNGVP